MCNPFRQTKGAEASRSFFCVDTVQQTVFNKRCLRRACCSLEECARSQPSLSRQKPPGLNSKHGKVCVSELETSEPNFTTCCLVRRHLAVFSGLFALKSFIYLFAEILRTSLALCSSPKESNLKWCLKLDAPTNREIKSDRFNGGVPE